MYNINYGSAGYYLPQLLLLLLFHFLNHSGLIPQKSGVSVQHLPTERSYFEKASRVRDKFPNFALSIVSRIHMQLNALARIVGHFQGEASCGVNNVIFTIHFVFSNFLEIKVLVRPSMVVEQDQIALLIFFIQPIFSSNVQCQFIFLSWGNFVSHFFKELNFIMILFAHPAFIIGQ